MPVTPESGKPILTLSPEEGWRLQGATWQSPEPLYAVVGDPISLSLSPTMHTAGLRERQIAALYLAARIRLDELPRLKRHQEQYGLRGFNVTAPLKEAAGALCDGHTDAARELEAVNTVQVRDGLWLGHNTDLGGIGAVLSQAWPHTEPPARATVLGAGGAARAALSALKEWGVPSIDVLTRSATRRQQFGSWLARWVGPTESAIRILPLVPADRAAPTTAGVWICCLPPGVDILPYLPAKAGPDTCLLLDLRYGAQLPAYEPPLGFLRVDGKPVLLMQGGLSFAWWFGPPVPWLAMRAALT